MTETASPPTLAWAICRAAAIQGIVFGEADMGAQIEERRGNAPDESDLAAGLWSALVAGASVARKTVGQLGQEDYPALCQGPSRLAGDPPQAGGRLGRRIDGGW